MLSPATRLLLHRLHPGGRAFRHWGHAQDPHHGDGHRPSSRPHLPSRRQFAPGGQRLLRLSGRHQAQAAIAAADPDTAHPDGGPAREVGRRREEGAATARPAWRGRREPPPLALSRPRPRARGTALGMHLLFASVCWR